MHAPCSVLLAGYAVSWKGPHSNDLICPHSFFVTHDEHVFDAPTEILADVTGKTVQPALHSMKSCGVVVVV